MKTTKMIKPITAGLIVALLTSAACSNSPPSVERAIDDETNFETADFVSDVKPQLNSTSQLNASESSGQSAGANNLASTAREADGFVDLPIIDLPAKEAIALLNEADKNGDDICNDRHRLENMQTQIPDYAESVAGELVPSVSLEFANIFAISAAGVTYKNYETVFSAWGNTNNSPSISNTLNSSSDSNPNDNSPNATDKNFNEASEQLLCIARLNSQPRLEIVWNNLTYLIRTKSTVRGGQLPTQLATVGVRSGEAVVVTCFPANGYGTVYDASGNASTQQRPQPDYPFLVENWLSWIGGRWRVQSVREHKRGCEELPKLVGELQQRLKADKSVSDWIFSNQLESNQVGENLPEKLNENLNKNWNWNESEVRQWLHS